MADLRPWFRQARRVADRAAGSVARSFGYELRRGSFYLPLPDADMLPGALWDRQSELLGVDLRLQHAVELLRQLTPTIAGFPEAFPISNGSYEWGDAHLLWGMLRHLKPRRVIELGSGASSHLIALARQRNNADGCPLAFESYDPFPGWHHLGAASEVTVHPIAAERLDPKVVDALDTGDILFVDTTHTVKTGGDVTHIVLHLLPRLHSGVYVHFHDVFLPHEYPRRWVLELRRAWAEQYLLQAFLAFNDQFEVVLPAHALWRSRHDQVASAIPAIADLRGEGPGAFWIRRR